MTTSTRHHDQDPGGSRTRLERKQRTRRAILDAALDVSADAGLAAVSLRQVAKEVGIVPTAFYRHFESIDALGLALVEESFASLREMLRDVRRAAAQLTDIIEASVGVLAEHVRSRPEHYRFLARERQGGSVVVRGAIGHEIELIQRELATDLARLQGADRWTFEDLQTAAHLIVSLMVLAVEDLLAAPSESAEAALRTRMATELRMFMIGANAWRSGA